VVSKSQTGREASCQLPSIWLTIQQAGHIRTYSSTCRVSATGSEYHKILVLKCSFTMLMLATFPIRRAQDLQGSLHMRKLVEDVQKKSPGSDNVAAWKQTKRRSTKRKSCAARNCIACRNYGPLCNLNTHGQDRHACYHISCKQ